MTNLVVTTPQFTTHPSPMTNLVVITPLLTTRPSPVTNLAVITPLLIAHPSPLTSDQPTKEPHYSSVSSQQPDDNPSTPHRSMNCSDNPFAGLQSSIFDDRPLASEKPLKSCKLRNLICVPLTTPSSADDKLLVSLFNARSVGTAEKRTEICNFVQDQNIDILFLTDLAYSQG